MELFEATIGLLFVAALLASLADRIAVPYPTMLALAGAAAAFLPGMPEMAIDPDLALALFVAPVLLDAAYDASPRDLKQNFRPVVRLALMAVALTVASVAVVSKWLMPDLPWAAAVALRAIVAPPDAAAATAVLRRLKPPHRLLVILEGESLFNDASALLIYRAAVAAVATGSFSLLEFAPTLVLVSLGSVALGWALGRFISPLLGRLFPDIAINVLTQFLSTFFVWILAEALNLSAIVAVVTYGMVVGQTAARRMGGRHRIASYAVWEVAVFVLNAFAFLLIGLQMRAVIGRLGGGPDSDWQAVALLAGAVCVTVVAVRLFWVLVTNAMMMAWRRDWGLAPAESGGHVTTGPNLRGGLLVSWAGMRGIVTLATALALPADFPARDAMVFTAVCVVLVTLGLQGLTLGWLLKRLGLADDGSVERESGLARRETAEAAIRALEREPDSETKTQLLREYEARRLFSGPEPPEEAPLAPSAIQKRALDAQRDRLERLRRDGTIGDTAYHAIEEELDLLEITADPRVRMA